MTIAPISNVSFEGYKPKDLDKFRKYVMGKRQGSVYDLKKKFEQEVIDYFVASKDIVFGPELQNWRLISTLKTLFRN